MSTVCALSVAAIKGTRLQSVDSIVLDRTGARGNRRFYLIDEHNRMVNAKHIGALLSVVSSFDGDRLVVTFPDGRRVCGEVSPGAAVQTRFFSRAQTARLIDGPWSQALSELAGRPLRLVEAVDGGAVDRGANGAVTLISRASLERFAAEAGALGVDPRRFRMLIEIDGVRAHGEDAWVGRRMRVGEAHVAWGGHVGRCLVTSRDPDSGAIDLPTLDVLRAYRERAEATEPLPFGIYGAVLRGGVVRVGDKVRPL